MFHIRSKHLSTDEIAVEQSRVYWFKSEVSRIGDLSYALPNGEAVFGLAVSKGNARSMKLLDSESLLLEGHDDYQVLLNHLRGQPCVEANCTINHSLEKQSHDN